MADYRAALERMNATPPGFEWLPEIWHVVYEEGIRGNHILFENIEIALTDRQTKRALNDWDTYFAKTIENRAVTLLRLNNIEVIKKEILALPSDERAALFLVYRYSLDLWQSALKRYLS